MLLDEKYGGSIRRLAYELLRVFLTFLLRLAGNAKNRNHFSFPHISYRSGCGGSGASREEATDAPPQMCEAVSLQDILPLNGKQVKTAFPAQVRTGCASPSLWDLYV